ncbi:MAG: NAD(P)H:quinone oxidoreductase, partial [Rhodospirillaceae bacterium]|nr:NAD(P)H:quinone oxidoreductase [Rhodospirillaceae bacterium]
MAQAIAEGVRSADNGVATIKRVAELVPEEVAREGGMKLDQEAPVADPTELGDYDGIIFGTPTRFG